MKNPKGLIPIVVVIVITVIAAAIVGVMWWYQNKSDERVSLNKDTNTNTALNSNADLNTNNTTNTNTTVNTNTPTPVNAEPQPQMLDDTSDWQTYTGKGITIKYPPDWEANDSLGTLNNFIGFREPTLKNDYNWSITTYSTSEKTIEGLIQNSGSQFTDRNERQEIITIDGIQAQKATITTNQYENWVSIQILFEKDGVIYQISNGAVVNEKFDTFYQSFQFTN